MHQNGNLKAAERIYRQVLVTDPNDPDALHLLGILLRRKGDPAQGIALIRRALSHRPDFAEAHYNLGNALVDAAQPAEAIAAYRRAVALRPNYTECWRVLAGILLHTGDEMAALEAFASLAEHAETQTDLLNYAIMLKRNGRREQALTQFDRAIEQAPPTPRAYRLRGEARSEVETTQHEALADLRAAHRLAPNDSEIHFFLGVLLRRVGELDEAYACFEAVLAQDPKHWAARYLICLGQLRPIYQSRAAIQDSRHRYTTHLAQLHTAIMCAREHDLKQAADGFGMGTPFVLPYQGHNDCELQRLWGEMICHAMAARYPDAAQPPPLPPLEGKPRIGILSAYFCRHSNWKLPIKGWVQALDRNRFHLTAYSIGVRRDDVTETARSSVDCFVDNLSGLDQWAQRIRADRLHALLIPEVGMVGMTVQLAALHLAPVQIGSWGHPETSGMPTMHYMLSSDLMEPANGQDWYSETLVRLPNLSTALGPPDVAETPFDLKPFGIGPDTVSYLCLQYLGKYLPDHDDIFPAIARRVRNARFIFLATGRHTEATLFAIRLRHAFEQAGLDPDTHLIFLPRLSWGQFVSLNAQGDVFLDSIGWSGCNTTVETLQFGTPVVTMAGDSMRSRHSAAILALLGRADLVAATTADYIELAVRLGQDPLHRRAVREDLLRRAPALYNDPLPAQALGDFLEKTFHDR
jgi:predicted O-linked N-acetylglucosamine transferase (SPINDLY family)